MANEIQTSVGLTVKNGAYSYLMQNRPLNVTQNALYVHDAVVDVGLAESDMPVGSVVTNGWLLVINLDATNYVTWGPKNSGAMVPCGRIKPNEHAYFRVEPGVTLRWKANTATVKLQMVFLND